MARHVGGPETPCAPKERGRPRRGTALATGDRSPRGRIAGTDAYLLSLVQSVNASSPRTNVAQFPEIERRRYRPFGPKVSPTATS